MYNVQFFGVVMATFLALIEFGSVYQGNWQIAFKFLSDNETANQNCNVNTKMYKKSFILPIKT